MLFFLFCNEAIPNNGLENRHKEETNATISPYHCVVKLAAVVSEDLTRGRQRNRFKTPFIPSPLKPEPDPW